jgi:hypothetical protein
VRPDGPSRAAESSGGRGGAVGSRSDPAAGPEACPSNC